MGKSFLKWSELEEVLLDVEINLNNRPLTYVEEDVQYPILTPNSMILGRDARTINENVIEDEELGWRKRQKYVKRCKDLAWKRWEREYLTALRERHNMKCKTNQQEIKVGDVVMIKGEDKRRGTWKVGIISEVYPGKDEEIRGVQVRTSTGILNRPIQLLYPLELHCDDIRSKQQVGNKSKKLNVQAREFTPRRTAATIASLRIKDVANDDNEDESS